jgi:hypothetical protein
MLLDVALTGAGCCPLRGQENEASTDLLLDNGETNMVGDSVILTTIYSIIFIGMAGYHYHA